jgi:hypothetical protein
MTGRRRDHWTHFHWLIVLVLIATLTGCITSDQRYLPADTGIDPFDATRERAESYFESGLVHERQGEWNAALKDFRQAFLWDPDRRQDIQDALTRAQSKTESQTARSPRVPLAGGDGSTTDMKLFTSNSLPYSIAFPSDWKATREDKDQQPIDTFQGYSGSTVAAVVMITVEPVRSDATLDMLYTATRQELEATGINDVRIAEHRQVGGQPSNILSYHIATSPGNASVRHAVFLTPGRAWHVILLATPATTPDLLKTFATMLDSLELLSSAFPVV